MPLSFCHLENNCRAAFVLCKYQAGDVVTWYRYFSGVLPCWPFWHFPCLRMSEAHLIFHHAPYMPLFTLCRTAGMKRGIFGHSRLDVSQRLKAQFLYPNKEMHKSLESINMQNISWLCGGMVNTATRNIWKKTTMLKVRLHGKLVFNPKCHRWTWT